MKGLIYKEFVLNSRNIAIPFLMQFMYGIMLISLVGDTNADDPLGSSLTVAAMYTGVCAFTYFMMYCFSYFYFQSDATKSWQNFSCSSPTGPAGQVGAKYIFVLTLFLSELLFYSVIALVCSAMYDISFRLLLAVNLLIFGIFIILASIELPFFFRLGGNMGNSVKGIIFVLIMLIGLAYLLFGDISVFEAEEPVLIIASKLSAASPLIIILSVIMLAMPIFCLSMSLSVKLYRKGIENAGT